MQAAIISRDHDLRSAAEQLIAEVYALHYSARITAFPATLIAMIGDGGAPLCAAGLRFAADGFFSECYLDAPVDAVLSALRRYPVAREKVFEVTSLASRAPHTIGPFLRKIIACGEAAGFEWAFFTATAPLKLILERLSLSLLPLAAAEPLAGRQSGRLGKLLRAHAERVCGPPRRCESLRRQTGPGGGAWLRSCRSCAVGPAPATAER